MASEVTICNRALQIIGTRTQIASLSESSVEARNCNAVYADTRDQVLQMAQWGFARKTAYLALLKQAPGTPGGVASATQWSTAYPPPPWLYEYALPDDCISMWQVIQQPINAYVGIPFTSNGQSGYPYFVGPGARFDIASDVVNGTEQSVILTNQYQAIGIYTRRVTIANLFPPLFVEALAAAIGGKIAMALTGSLQVANAAFGYANKIIGDARAEDANEGLDIIDNVPDWLAIRDDFGYGVDAADVGYVAPYGPLFGYI